MNMDDEWWDIYRYQECGPDPFIAPAVSDRDEEIKPYKGERIPKWKDVVVKVSIILAMVLVITLSELVRSL